jgi:hypothetical protein
VWCLEKFWGWDVGKVAVGGVRAFDGRGVNIHIGIEQ